MIYKLTLIAVLIYLMAFQACTVVNYHEHYHIKTVTDTVEVIVLITEENENK